MVSNCYCAHCSKVGKDNAMGVLQGLQDHSVSTNGNPNGNLCSVRITGFHLYKSSHFTSLLWLRNATPSILMAAHGDTDGLLKW